MKLVYYISLFFLLQQTLAFAQLQPNPRQVLGSTGGSNTAPWGSVDYTVGETMVTTYTPGSPFTIKTITQGFQQPDNNIFSITEASVNSTCIGANNGSIALTPLNTNDTLTYTWTPAVAGDTNVAAHLAPGTYQYSVTDGITTINGTVTITEDQVDCRGTTLSFYTGITPNGDGNNDNWQIDSIINFPENIVSIYNRWGDLVWVGKNYDNVNVVWEGKNRAGKDLPDATYFYLVEVNKEKYKGWVELTH
ncbi:MAG TPA: gliding motility-associated C-terminal domain-containing protein [Bacteroidia bacterium]